MGIPPCHLGQLGQLGGKVFVATLSPKAFHVAAETLIQKRFELCSVVDASQQVVGLKASVVIVIAYETLHRTKAYAVPLPVVGVGSPLGQHVVPLRKACNERG
jgi:hypothetical protein